MQEYTAEVLYRPEREDLRFLPEGPYSRSDGRFSWVAIQHGADANHGSLNVLDPATGENVTFELTGRPGFAFPTEDEQSYVIGMERTIQLFDIQTGESVSLSEPVDDGVEGTIINDGVTFAAGLVFGCKDLKFEQKKAGLYLWRRSNQSLIQLRSDQVCSNGKVIQPNGDHWRLLDIDTPTKQVVAYDLDAEAGTLSEPTVVVDLRDRNDFPDGMIATPDGQSVIIAFYNPIEAHHGVAGQFSLADGRMEALRKTPGSPQVTCPQLINVDGEVKLVLTTAVEHMSTEKQKRCPNAGCLYIAETPFEEISDQPKFRT